MLGCRKYRAAVKASSDDEAGPSSAPAESRLPPPPAGGPPPIKEEDSVTRERHIGKGMLDCSRMSIDRCSISARCAHVVSGACCGSTAGACALLLPPPCRLLLLPSAPLRADTGVAGVLGLLKDRGELNGAGSLRAVEWAGRTNDMKPVALQVGTCSGSNAPQPPFGSWRRRAASLVSPAVPRQGQGATRSERWQKDVHVPSNVYFLSAVRPFMLFIPCSMSHRPECISFSANLDIACACVGS